MCSAETCIMRTSLGPTFRVSPFEGGGGGEGEGGQELAVQFVLYNHIVFNNY